MGLHPQWSAIPVSVPFNNGTVSVELPGILATPDPSRPLPLVIITNGPATTKEVLQTLPLSHASRLKIFFPAMPDFMRSLQRPVALSSQFKAIYANDHCACTYSGEWHLINLSSSCRLASAMKRWALPCFDAKWIVSGVKESFSSLCSPPCFCLRLELHLVYNKQECWNTPA